MMQMFVHKEELVSNPIPVRVILDIQEMNVKLQFVSQNLQLILRYAPVMELA
jgi:hypothetical protein